MNILYTLCNTRQFIKYMRIRSEITLISTVVVTTIIDDIVDRYK